jgi:Family of unknown function (DUF5372)
VTGPVRITHPFHPQCGQEIALVVQRAQWGEHRVFYQCAHGHLVSIPAAWTSLVPEDPFVVLAKGQARFRVNDLIALTALLSRLRK